MKESEARGRNSFQDLLKQACQWRTLQYILVSHLLVLYFGDINSGDCARKSKRWDRDAEKNTVMQVWLSGKNKKTHISAEYICVCVWMNGDIWRRWGWEENEISKHVAPMGSLCGVWSGRAVWGYGNFEQVEKEEEEKRRKKKRGTEVKTSGGGSVTGI